MATRVLHLSDLHFGRNDKPESIEALGRLVEEARPELVIASGDLTHRGLRSQHEKASAFLRGLNLPLLTIPGNHDIPYTFPKRFTRPWQEFERLWGTTEPVYRSDALVVVGLNSVRPWRHQSGPVGEHAVVVSIAPGFGQPRPNRRGEARGLHIYEIANQAVRILTYIWRDDGWGLTAVRTFPRGREPLAFEPR